MPDPRFFKSSGPFTVQEIARLSGAEVEERGGKAPDMLLKDVAPLDQAGPGDLSFFDNIRYKAAFSSTQAGACFVSPKMVEFAPEGTVLLVSKSPYKAYALAAQAFYPENRPPARIAENSYIDPSAVIGESCVVEAGACIGAHARIGACSWIGPGAVIGGHVELGRHTKIGANAVISHALIGDHVHIYPGACIGQDGFGFAMDAGGHVKVPQLGRVVIEDHVEIGAGTAIDRGAGPDTLIGAGTWIDNLVQIGHNVKIGRGCVIVSQSGISGSTVIDDYVAIGGQSGIAGHLHIGKGARIAAKSGIMRDIPPGEEQMGYPAVPIKQFMRQIATLNRMIKKNKKQ